MAEVPRARGAAMSAVSALALAAYGNPNEGTPPSQEALDWIDPAWKSFRKGHITWSRTRVVELAEFYVKELPDGAARVLKNGTHGGGEIVALKNMRQVPKAKDIISNYVWLSPTVTSPGTTHKPQKSTTHKS